MTVVVKEVHSYDRPSGRKAGELRVSFVVDGTHHYATFALRVDVDKGRFIAVDGDQEYIAPTKDELIQHMQGVASAKLALTWTRYIEIDYSVAITNGTHNHSGLGPNESRKCKQCVGGGVSSIHLDFDVVEYSNAFKSQTNGAKTIIRRIIDVDGGGHHSEERRHEVPKDLIPYNLDRVATLRDIRAALTAVDAKMCELFRGKAAAVAERLDAITLTQLALPPAGATPGKVRK